MVRKKKSDKIETEIVEEKTELKQKATITVGQSLKVLREEKKIKLKDIAKHLNLRVAQLKAIEDGDMDELPGMTYALGFVRGYAKYLGLDEKEVSKQFKIEQGQEEADSSLSFPEPVDENVVPSPVVIGLAAFCCIFLLIVWTIYSNVNNDALPTEGEVTVLQGQAEMESVDIKPEEVMSDIDLDIDEASPMPDDADLATSEKAIEEVDVQLGDNNLTKENIDDVIEVEGIIAEEPDFNKEDNQLLKDIAENKLAEEAFKKKAKINISRKKNRVVLVAKEASWIQVADNDQKVIFRKVLRPGDKYLVPEKKGLTLVTANAGGLNIFVDDKKVQSIGDSGEIVRGVSLNPKELSLTRIRSRR